MADRGVAGLRCPSRSALYLTVTAIQAVTRAGFDPKNPPLQLVDNRGPRLDPSSQLHSGRGLVLFAVGVGRVLRKGRGARWVPWLFAWKLTVELPGDSALDGCAGTLRQHDQPVEFVKGAIVGAIAFLWGRAGIRGHS